MCGRSCDGSIALRAMQEDPRLARAGFAKLIGRCNDEDFEFFFTKYEILLGRNSKSALVDVVLGELRPLHLRSRREQIT